MIGRWLCRHDRHHRPMESATTFLLAVNLSNPSRCHIPLSRHRWTIGWRRA